MKTRGSPQAGLSSFNQGGGKWSFSAVLHRHKKNRQVVYTLPVLPYFKIGRITKNVL